MTDTEIRALIGDVLGAIAPEADLARVAGDADHRVCDGHLGGLLLAAIDRYLQGPEEL